ncbi:MAG: YlxM family DNA-binding protein [Lachnospiraceae bacterium]|jgi:predicted DNA-binding protein YlxM (UPF0122 family)|nr:YlxM family DNA-binding protein [Lachnospiraceae bacterium]
MEKIVELGMLYDFYGELLTTYQRSIMEDYVYHNLSLAEIAEERQSSRQAVHDLLGRCERSLRKYEAKLKLVARFMLVREKIEELSRLAAEGDSGDSKLTKRVNEICAEILEEL